MTFDILNFHEGILIKTFLRMAETVIPKMKFRVRATEDNIEGHSYFDIILEHEWQEKYKPLFEQPWLYSSWDEPLLSDGTIVTLEIECWEPRWVKNIKEVEDECTI